MKKTFITLLIIILSTVTFYYIVKNFVYNKWQETEIQSCQIQNGYMSYIITVKYKCVNKLIWEYRPKINKTEVFKGRINLKNFKNSTQKVITYFDDQDHKLCLLNNTNYLLEYSNYQSSLLKINSKDINIIKKWNGAFSTDIKKKYFIICTDNKNSLYRFDSELQKITLPKSLSSSPINLLISNKEENCYFLNFMMNNIYTTPYVRIYDLTGSEIKKISIYDRRNEMLSFYCNKKQNDFLFLLEKSVSEKSMKSCLFFHKKNNIKSHVFWDTGNVNTVNNRIVWHNNRLYLLSQKLCYDKISLGATKVKLLIWDYFNDKHEIKGIKIHLQ